MYHGSAHVALKKQLREHDNLSLRLRAEKLDGTTCVGFFGTCAWYGRTAYEYFRMIDERYLEFVLRQYAEALKDRLPELSADQRGYIDSLFPELPRDGSRR